MKIFKSGIVYPETSYFALKVYMERALVSCTISMTLLKHDETKINFPQVLNVIQLRFQIENSVSPGFFRKPVDSAHTTSFCAHYLPLDCFRLMSQ